MSVSSVSRRAALLSLGGLSVFSLGAIRRARAENAVRFRDIRIDVWPLIRDSVEWIVRAVPAGSEGALVEGCRRGR
jgi:hypothetical protein